MDQNNAFANRNCFKFMIRPLKIQFYFSFVAITHKPPVKRSEIALLVIYNALWVIDVSSKIYCFQVSRLNVFSFAMVQRLLSSCAWWAVYRQRYKIRNSLQHLYSLRCSSAGSDTYCSGLTLRLVITLLLLSACIPGFYSAYVFVKRHENHSLTQGRKCSSLIRVSESQHEASVVYFLWQVLDQHLDWSIHYAIAVLYCFSCVQLSSIVRALCSTDNLESQRIWQRYYSVRRYLKEIEERYSFLIFIFMGRAFVEFFRVLTFFLNKTEVIIDVLFSAVAIFYSCIVVSVFLCVVFSANTLQCNYRKLCEMMTELPRNMYCADTDLEAS
ncbi:hypothetical protein AVEN_266221-1, partial [Araneus ventricosus]